MSNPLSRPHRATEDTRLVRILKLTRLITHRRMSRAALAEHFGITERQVDRDIHLLRASDVQVERNRAGYHISVCPVCSLDPDTPNPRAAIRLQHLWAKIDRRGDDECWPWLGHMAQGRWPVIRWDQARPFTSVRRIMWRLTYGDPVPQRIWTTCGNPRCLNPAHLSDGKPNPSRT